MSVDIDPYPVSELNNRYGVRSRQTINDRLKYLQIKPFKHNGRSCITASQLQILDLQNEHLRRPGATLADFKLNSADALDELDISSVDKLDRVERSTLDALDTAGTINVPIHPQEYVVLIEAIACAIRPAEPLAYLAQLESAATHGWLLPTSKVKELISVKPRCKKGERVYSYGCFNFVKTDQRIRGQTAWKVIKANELPRTETLRHSSSSSTSHN